MTCGAQALEVGRVKACATIYQGYDVIDLGSRCNPAVSFHAVPAQGFSVEVHDAGTLPHGTIATRAR